MNKQEQQHQQEKPAVPSVAEGVSEVVNAAFGVGAAIAKTLAEATAAGKPVTRPEAQQGPFGEMVHYGVTTLTNVIGLVVSVMGGVVSGATDRGQSVSPGAAEPPVAREKGSGASNHPKVHQRGTLRIPLSMENPTDQPMENLVFICQGMRGKRLQAGQPLTETAMRFQPERLDIAPKDFEKLTLLIETDAQTAPGDYVAHVGVATGDFQIKVEFEVLPGEENS